MKIWLDDIRPSPKGYMWCKSVNQVIWLIQTTIEDIEVVGRANMERIILRYWR